MYAHLREPLRQRGTDEAVPVLPLDEIGSPEKRKGTIRVGKGTLPRSQGEHTTNCKDLGESKLASGTNISRRLALAPTTAINTVVRPRLRVKSLELSRWKEKLSAIDAI